MIYFDNAATTMIKPECVLKADAYALKSLSANAGRGSHSAAIKAAQIVYEGRKAVKKLTACDDTAFTFNCTDALNAVIFGTAKKGGHIVTTVYEHNGTLRPIHELGKRMGVTYTAVRPNAHGVIDPAEIEHAIRPNTYLIAVNHASNVTGVVAPVAQIGNIAKRHGIPYLIDGAQSVGYLNVNMREIGCNYLCFSPHKGLHGTQGLGCLCVRGNPPLTPYRFGGTGTASHTLVQPTDFPEGFESGTLPVHSIFALIAAITHYQRQPLSVTRNLAEVGDFLRTELSKINGVKIYGKYNTLPNIVCFNLAKVNAAAVGNILNEQYDIAVRCGLHCAPLCHTYLGTIDTGAVRASLSYHNTAAEVEFFIKSIREISK
ncbi:MAG: aminotransferase class V-fold PLP-dependent enzyme [Clostridiales bacterium]|nr:aminotransferase class V-fold PLP-dependent enzyme [Clostridiales bacterium]